MKHAVSRQSKDAEAQEEKQRAEFQRLTESVDALLGQGGDDAAFDRMHDEIARLRQSIRGDMSTTVRNEVGEQVRAGIDEGLAGSIDSIGKGLASLGEATQASAESVMPRVEALGQQIAELRESVCDLPGTLKLNRLEDQLKEMALAVQGMARHMESPQPSHFEQEGFAQIESRLDEISRALVAVGGTAEVDLSSLDLSGIGRLETRVDEMSGALDLSGIERLETRMVDLMAHVEHLSEEAQAAREVEAARMGEARRELEELDRLGHQIAALGERLVDIEAHAETSSRAAARVLSHAPDFSGIENQMEGLAQRLDAMAEADTGAQAVSALESQVSNLALTLQQAGFGHVDLSPLELRLAQIENQVSANQNAAVEAAEQAARSVAAMLGDRTEEGRIVSELAGELRVMQDAVEQADTRNAQSFDTVRSVLDAVGDRLASIERGINAPAADIGDRLTGIERAIEEQSRMSGSLDAALAAMRSAPSAAAPAAVAPAQPFAFAAAPETAPEPFSLEPAPVVAPALDAHAAFDAPTDAFGEADDDMIRPGEGAPDLDAIVERASRKLSGGASEPVLEEVGLGMDRPQVVDPAAETHTDVIAAARRAVQATRAELDAVHQERDGADGGKGLAAILEKLPKLNLRIAAAIALAAAVLGSGYYFVDRITGPSNARVAAIEEPAQIAPVDPNAADAQASLPNAPEAQLPAPANPVPAPFPENAGEQMLPEPVETARAEVPEPPVSPATIVPAEPDTSALPTENAEVPALPAALTAPSALTQGPAIARDGSARAVPDASAPKASEEIAPAVAEAPVRPLAVDVPAGIASEALRDAARKGDRVAIYEIGVRYSQGRGVKRDMKLAADWFGRAAERGFAPGEYSLGSLHEKGVGVPRDLDRASELYASAAEKGNARAMHNLAVINAQDMPDRKADFAKALGLWEQAAALGVKDSQFNLGILYARGMGVAQDLVQSYKWFAVAARDGDADARAKRDDVANLMEPDDIARGKELADKWQGQEPITSANVVEIPAEWNEGPQQVAAAVAAPDKPTVKRVQTLLNRAGFSVGQPDGLAGPRTTRAIMEFQRSWSLPMSGKIDAALMNALEDAAA